jgi:hypothetical protein
VLLDQWLVHVVGLYTGGACIRGGLIFGGAYSRRFLRYAEFQAKMAAMKSTYLAFVISS